MENWLFLTELEISKKIGDRIKQIRLQHNLTQKAMSEEVGLSVSTISLIEQGKPTTLDKNNIAEIRPGDIIQPEGFSYWLMKFDGANKTTLNES